MDFLAEACAGDSALRIEVQELLDSAEETTSLLDTEPCGPVLPRQPHSPPIFAAGDVVAQRYVVIRFIEAVKKPGSSGDWADELPSERHQGSVESYGWAELEIPSLRWLGSSGCSLQSA